MGYGLLVGAGSAVVAALLVLRFLPAGEALAPKPEVIEPIVQDQAA